MKRSLMICVILAATALVLTGCPKKTEKVSIGYIPHVSALPFFVAMEKGYFKNEGLDVNFVECGYREFTDALLTGKVDVSSPTSFPTIFGIEAESPRLLRYFLAGGEAVNGDTVYALVVKKNSQMGSIQDLKGKKIGVTDPVTALNLRVFWFSSG
jgi:NitT/TauT family transport system substrate-binding protein